MYLLAGNSSHGLRSWLAAGAFCSHLHSFVSSNSVFKLLADFTGLRQAGKAGETLNEDIVVLGNSLSLVIVASKAPPAITLVPGSLSSSNEPPSRWSWLSLIKPKCVLVSHIYIPARKIQLFFKKRELYKCGAVPLTDGLTQKLAS